MDHNAFDKKLLQFFQEFKESDEIQDYVLHNMGYYVSNLVNFELANQHRVDFDFRDDYWWKTENRFLLKFLMENFVRNFVPTDELRKEIYQLAQCLVEIRSKGDFVDLPPQGYIENKKHLIQYGQIIHDQVHWKLDQFSESSVVEHHKALKGYKNLAEAFCAFCLEFPQSNDAKKMDGSLVTRLKFVHYLTAPRFEDLESHATFFATWYGLFTKTNAYQVGGAQVMGPVLGNENCMRLLNIVEEWKSGRSLKEAPFIADNSWSDEKFDQSHYMPVIELFSFSRLDQFPILNSVSQKYFQDRFGVNEEQRPELLLETAKKTKAFLNSEEFDSIKGELENIWDKTFDEAKRHVESSVTTEKIQSKKKRAEFKGVLLTDNINKAIQNVAKQIKPPKGFDKALALMHLIMDGCIYTSKVETKIKEKVEKASRGTKYWMYAPGENASQWEELYDSSEMSIGWGQLGDLSKFETTGELENKYIETFNPGSRPSNNCKALWQFANTIKPGDIIIAKNGIHKLVGYGRVTSEYFFKEGEDRFSHRLKVKWLANQEVSIPEDQSRNVKKTLTDITGYGSYAQDLLDCFSLESGSIGSIEDALVADEVPDFKIEHAMEDLFLEKEELQKIVKILEYKKNIILEGPPGVGKTFVAKRIAKLHMRRDDEAKIEMVQFHQSYSYEDFIQGYRPDESGGFKLKDGIFYKFCEKAGEDPHGQYYFIIDEINRGNLSKIFGEVLMLIESDKRGEKHQIALTYSEKGKKFYIPENVHIIGTMNTADRSLAFVDYALRRRFAFVQLDPQFRSPKFKEFLTDMGVQPDVVSKIQASMGQINSKIEGDKRRLGRGYCIGHSYFCPSSKGQYDMSWYKRIVDNEVLPLINEYWFDDSDQAEEANKLAA